MYLSGGIVIQSFNDEVMDYFFGEYVANYKSVIAFTEAQMQAGIENMMHNLIAFMFCGFYFLSIFHEESKKMIYT